MSNILLGVTGGIATYKVVHLVRLLKKAGHDVRVIMTENGAKFVTPMTFEYLSGHPASINEFADVRPESIEHIGLGQWADIFVIAPATANTIAKIAHGIGDNLLTSTVLACPKQLMVCPAMNTNMYENAATQENIAILARRGAIIVDPASGELACGVYGAGRMPEPEEIFDAITRFLTPETPLAGKRVLVSAGPTREAIDPVRYITNRSSGKMGYAVAEAARSMGAEVVLVSGPVSLTQPNGVTVIPVESAKDMLGALTQQLSACDILVMSAAVADYAMETVADQKMKKTADDVLTLRLVKNPDILKELSALKRAGQVFVGFAAETEELKQNALKKLTEKKLDMIVANDVSRKDIGFDSDFNETVLLSCDGSETVLERSPKTEIAREILNRAALLLTSKES